MFWKPPAVTRSVSGLQVLPHSCRAAGAPPGWVPPAGHPWLAPPPPFALSFPLVNRRGVVPSARQREAPSVAPPPALCWPRPPRPSAPPPLGLRPLQGRGGASRRRPACPSCSQGSALSARPLCSLVPSSLNRYRSLFLTLPRGPCQGLLSLRSLGGFPAGPTRASLLLPAPPAGCPPPSAHFRSPLSRLQPPS